MAGLKSLMSRRRRVGEEGEDEDGPVIVDDSQSEGSLLSDEEDVSSLGDMDGAEASGAAESAEGAPEAAANGAAAVKKSRKPKKKSKSKKGKEQGATESSQLQGNFKAMADTEAMMNGLRIDNGEQAAVDFENMGQHGTAAPAAEAAVMTIPTRISHVETAVQTQRREHEEYRRKRDADPAFIPNRGNFFMHDTRSHHNGQPPPMRGAWQGRGRGRGGPVVGGPFSPANQMAQAERAAEQTWKHDLHDTINEESSGGHIGKPADSPQQREADDSARLFPKPMAPRQPEARVVSFSSTTLVGKVQIRVSLPGMKAPVAFSEVPWKHYIRLPNHRPPLRRDKPVRVSLPDRPPHYIFPSHDRSFIFIPRQNRPNQHQQGYHRGSYQRSLGGYGYSSRRTSMYGGSMYASSVAASRRSSLAGISRADAFSPTSFASGMPPPNQPVVRLPHGAFFSGVNTPSGPMSGQQTPIMHVHTYPLPQQPAFQGTPTNTMHQPRPQKTISVTGIESPALLQQAPSQEPQPFQNQLPAHMHEHSAYPQPQQPYYSPHQQFAYPQQQPQAGTPLSRIPEQAMHAQPFQPPMPYGQSPFYPSYPPQQQYYYSPPEPNGYQPMPMYMPSQGYVMPPQGPPQHVSAPQPISEPTGPLHEQEQQSHSGMVARESNGMVFYVPQSEVEQDNGQQVHYQPAESFVPSYAMPGLPPPTPAPETSAAAYYYPPMQPDMYFPSQS